MKKLDLKKPIQTVGGDIVRIICTNRIGKKPVIGLISRYVDYEGIYEWDKEGLYNGQKDPTMNLVNTPMRKNE